MKPDRVIGLLPWAKLPYDEIFFPISGRASLLLPFLVVEAKSETGGSGFRAIQHQTAFPIRRFLRAQTEVIGPDSACEPPLVWFFAYQGELWRLHACLRDDDKVVGCTTQTEWHSHADSRVSRRSTTYGRERFSLKTEHCNCFCWWIIYGRGPETSIARPSWTCWQNP
jgi:hypothetical protein